MVASLQIKISYSRLYMKWLKQLDKNLASYYGITFYEQPRAGIEYLIGREEAAVYVHIHTQTLSRVYTRTYTHEHRRSIYVRTYINLHVPKYIPVQTCAHTNIANGSPLIQSVCC